MRRAAERVRTGEIGDETGAREATAKLLEHLADRDALDTHTHDRAANLANRVLATSPLA